MFSQKFSYKRMETISELFTDIFKNHADNLSSEVINFMDELRNKILDNVISNINLEPNKDPSLWCGPEIKGSLWMLLSIFRSCKNYEQVSLSRKIRPALLNLHNSMLCPIQIKIESSMQNNVNDWMSFLQTLEIYWNVLNYFCLLYTSPSPRD